MRTYFLMAALLPAFYACHSPAVSKKNRPVQIDTMELVAPPDNMATRVASNEVSVAKTDSTTYIRFGSSYLSLDWLEPTPGMNDFELHPDTIYLTLQHPHTLEGQMLTITSTGNARLNVAQRYETTAILTFKQVHVLKHWKHYISDWEALKPEADNFFICKKYSAEQRRSFPPSTIEELKDYVYHHLGKEASAGIMGITNIADIPTKVVISRYYLKITGLLQHSSENINKLLIIDVPIKQ
ncbi:MAG: hypothetical protein JO154_18450 [Chitinophaga sp.]|uniref:hypothetical protein n=1 Tax=Chitinophaga sp. TaxID=1869181 RepID=UPI0025C258ED|nr:hypothetical protein [Chitinophaga sp.]MBV8254589.1 hypothetical protein [Chitinophaga sp.]